MAILRTFAALIVLILSCIGSDLLGQTNRVEIIDYYGRGFAKMQSVACLPFRENDTISFLDDDLAFAAAKIKIEKCLLNLPAVRQVEVSFVCCTQPGNNWMVFIGADTASAPVAINNKTADVKLPKEITNKYDQMLELVMEAIEKEEADEDYSNGHSLIKYAPIRKIQEEYIPYANANLNLLQSVLRTSKYPEEREVAAAVIAYHSNKKDIITDLLEAVTDTDEGVRNNAIRAIGILVNYSFMTPELNIRIDAGHFITLMNSISWTDRNKSSLVLLSLTKDHDQKILNELKSKALKSITDMAGWKSFGHSMPGYILLGRLTGWSEQAIMSGVNNERKAQIEEMLKAIK